jgi:hypothetical protein
VPSRVIRGEINSSDSLSRVSLGADLTFRALIVAVDDYGRIDARPAMLKAALFPVRDVPASLMLGGISNSPGGKGTGATRSGPSRRDSHPPREKNRMPLFLE